MEKTVTKKLNRKADTEKNTSEKKTNKAKKGPKTVVKDDLVQMKGDPLGLNVPLSEEVKPGFDVSERIRHKDDIVVERYNPEVDRGLSIEDVESRQMAGLANVTDTGSTKSITSIIMSNILTFFNFLNFGIAAWLISVGSSIGHLLFMGVITANITDRKSVV